MAGVGGKHLPLAIAAVVAALVLLVVLVALGLSREKDVLGPDGCLAKRETDAVHVILIDVSERVPAIQAKFLEDGLLQFIEGGNQEDEVRRGDEVVVYLLTQNPLEPVKSLTRVCSPGGEADNLIEGKRRWERLKRARFTDPVRKAIAAGISSGELAQSPILEAIVSIDAREFRRGRTRKSLVVASDLLQHSAMLSHYGDLPPLEDFRKTPEYALSRPNLEDARIRFLYIRRKAHFQLQGERHINWWADWVVGNGGSFLDPAVTPIRGDFQ